MKRFVCLFLVAAISVLSLAGCASRGESSDIENSAPETSASAETTEEPVTAEELVAGMASATTYKGFAVMGYVMTMFGSEYDISLIIDADYLYDGQNTYLNGTTTTKITGPGMDENEVSQVETYQIWNGEDFDVYRRSGEETIYSHSTTEVINLFTYNLDDAVLLDETDDYNGTECYVVKGDYSIDFDSLPLDNGISTEIIENLSLDAFLYFDKGTGRIFAAELDGTEMMRQGLAEALADSGEESSFGMSITGFTIKFTDFGFDEVDEITFDGDFVEQGEATETAKIDETSETTAETAEETDESDIPLSGTFEWKDEYNTYTVDGYEITLGTTTLGELLENVNVDYEDTDQTLEAYGSAFFYDNEYTSVISISNMSEEAKPATECTVEAVLFYPSVYKTEFCGLTPESTLDEVFAKFGNPTNVAEDSVAVTYYWEDGWSYIKFDCEKDGYMIISVQSIDF